MNFSDKIKFQREQNHLTQKELAELVGVSQRAIAAYESSGTIARISTMRKLAHALYLNAPFINTLKENGLEGVIRLKDERRRLFQDAEGLFYRWEGRKKLFQ